MLFNAPIQAAKLPYTSNSSSARYLSLMTPITKLSSILCNVLDHILGLVSLLVNFTKFWDMEFRFSASTGHEH